MGIPPLTGCVPSRSLAEEPRPLTYVMRLPARFNNARLPARGLAPRGPI